MGFNEQPSKLLTKCNIQYVTVFSSLPWLVNRNLTLKIFKCHNILLSQCRNICAKISSVYRPLSINLLTCLFLYTHDIFKNLFDTMPKYFNNTFWSE